MGRSELSTNESILKLSDVTDQAVSLQRFVFQRNLKNQQVSNFADC